MLALTSLALIISYLTFYPDMINNLSNALFYVSGSGDFDISGDLLSGYTSYNIYISSVSELLKLIVSVMLSVFGFSYNRYIKGLSESIKSGSRAVNDSPTDRAVQISSDNVPEFVSPTHPLSFEPQPVFGAQTDASQQAALADEYQASEGSADAAEPNPYITQNPYANQNNNSRNSYAKQKHPQKGSDCPQTIVCPECGSECPSNTLFCGNCGKNLRR
ncbi:MAG: hypothetical protein LUF33_06255 [Clostridiales bacterium]|nr:hypothetical protein [Clostridiales bacterium]